MDFPKDWKDFLASYSFIDHEEVYTNKSELIPCFRVEQLIEHYFPNEKKRPCKTCEDLEFGDSLYQYSSWEGGINFDQIKIQYCPICGKKLKTWKKKKEEEFKAKKEC